MTTEQKIQYIADHYGYEPQSRQLIEEMAELTVAINKGWRKSHPLEYSAGSEYEHISEEMADTVIMIWQIKYLLGVGEGEKIQKIMREKNIGEVKRKRRNRKYLKRHTALSYIRKRMKKKVNSGR